jgi:hypothetical protein
MRHRHLDISPGTPVGELGLAAIDDLLERGDVGDWAPLLADVARDPWGRVADRILHLVEHHPMPGRSALWRSWVEERRAAAEGFHAGAALRRLRAARGLTQQQVADRLGMTQPEISKLERRRDVTVSTFRSYVGAVGGRLELLAVLDGESLEIG